MPKLIIGDKYLVPTESGKEIPGVLEDATVMNREVYGVYALEDGRRIIAKCPLNEDELNDYEVNPDTFFGVARPVSRSMETALDAFDFFFDSYKNTSREKLLEILKNAIDFDQLKTLSQRELAEILSERYAYKLIADRESQRPKRVM